MTGRVDSRSAACRCGMSVRVAKLLPRGKGTKMAQFFANGQKGVCKTVCHGAKLCIYTGSMKRYSAAQSGLARWCAGVWCCSHVSMRDAILHRSSCQQKIYKLQYEIQTHVKPRKIRNTQLYRARRNYNGILVYALPTSQNGSRAFVECHSPVQRLSPQFVEYSSSHIGLAAALPGLGLDTHRRLCAHRSPVCQSRLWPLVLRRPEDAHAKSWPSFSAS
jgi:hypothetical protein